MLVEQQQKGKELTTATPVDPNTNTKTGTGREGHVDRAGVFEEYSNGEEEGMLRKDGGVVRKQRGRKPVGRKEHKSKHHSPISDETLTDNGEPNEPRKMNVTSKKQPHNLECINRLKEERGRTVEPGSQKAEDLEWKNRRDQGAIGNGANKAGEPETQLQPFTFSTAGMTFNEKLMYDAKYKTDIAGTGPSRNL